MSRTRTPRTVCGKRILQVVSRAGAGTAAQMMTKGQAVTIPWETRIDFTLRGPLTLSQ
jgi:hypothetical protein